MVGTSEVAMELKPSFDNFTTKTEKQQKSTELTKKNKISVQTNTVKKTCCSIWANNRGEVQLNKQLPKFTALKTINPL
jgi:hypothetical protein